MRQTLPQTDLIYRTYTDGFATTVFEVKTNIYPTLSNFSIPSKTYGSLPFVLVDPSSNSDARFNYTISGDTVATVSGKTVTIVNAGITNIRASQDISGIYLEGSIDASFQVIAASAANPVPIESGAGLTYFLMSTTAPSAVLTGDVNVDQLQVNSASPKTLSSLPGSTISIYK